MPRHYSNTLNLNIRMTSIYNKLCKKKGFFPLIGHICIRDKDCQMCFKRSTYKPFNLIKL